MSNPTDDLVSPPVGEEPTVLRRDPETPEQWQDAANLATAYQLLDAAKAYGLTTGGPEISVPRCDEIIARAKGRGIVPQREGIKAAIIDVLRACAKGGQS